MANYILSLTSEQRILKRIEDKSDRLSIENDCVFIFRTGYAFGLINNVNRKKIKYVYDLLNTFNISAATNRGKEIHINSAK